MLGTSTLFASTIKRLPISSRASSILVRKMVSSPGAEQGDTWRLLTALLSIVVSTSPNSQAPSPKTLPSTSSLPRERPLVPLTVPCLRFPPLNLESQPSSML